MADGGRRIVATGDAPAAIGPYSQAVVAGGFVFTAGQIPLDPATMELVEGGIAEQTERVMRSLEAVLTAAGASFGSVVKTTCFLADLNDFAAFNAVYGRYFGDTPPGRSTVQVAKLPKGALVEVECIAQVAD
jgi:2-iminobutanoate/2-iminopropanoate deaminase